jgi:CBS domain containing-hemolysin-like protein
MAEFRYRNASFFLSVVIPWLVLLVAVSIPAYVGQTSDRSFPPTWFWASFSGLCIFLLAAFAASLAIVAALYLYSPVELVAKRYFRAPKFFGRGERSQQHAHRIFRIIALRNAAASYFLTIYVFALVYRFTCIYCPAAFDATMDGMTSSIYFSVVTIATVGYGDIVPKYWFSRLFVTAEILLGVAFTIIFFSIVATFLKESATTFLRE